MHTPKYVYNSLLNSICSQVAMTIMWGTLDFSLGLQINSGKILKHGYDAERFANHSFYKAMMDEQIKGKFSCVLE